MRSFPQIHVSNQQLAARRSAHRIALAVAGGETVYESDAPYGEDAAALAVRLGWLYPEKVGDDPKRQLRSNLTKEELNGLTV